MTRERNEKVGEKLKKLIEEKGTNRNAVARATGIDDAYLYRMLDGKREWKLRYLEAVLATWTSLWKSFSEAPWSFLWWLNFPPWNPSLTHRKLSG
jgi:predicted transcriptional regulator